MSGQDLNAKRAESFAAIAHAACLPVSAVNDAVERIERAFGMLMSDAAATADRLVADWANRERQQKKKRPARYRQGTKPKVPRALRSKRRRARWKR